MRHKIAQLIISKQDKNMCHVDKYRGYLQHKNLQYTNHFSHKYTQDKFELFRI